MINDNSIALQISNLFKVYGNQKKALDDVSLCIPEGSFYALLGPNGAGKSSLINILSDTSTATKGQITFFGKNLFTDKMWCKRRLGIVPQEAAFDPFFKVKEILHITAGLYGQKLETKWLDELLSRLQLDEHADKNARQLSGGMRRRLLIAQALVHKPPFIVLDEPTAGVDAELRRQLWSFVQELNQQGSTILLTTHYLEEAQMLCNKVAILNQGKIICEQNMQDMINVFAQRELVLQFNKPILEPQLADFKIQSDQKTMRITLNTEMSFHAAYSQAVQHYGEPCQVDIQQENLEDIFLRVTQ
ncbi:MAG: ABC transporter ATP-binding protein [Mariprofundaceae bacterium]|nr:ABC transporter ATP-binding protein [Mariprofundaceae bacterium]